MNTGDNQAISPQLVDTAQAGDAEEPTILDMAVANQHPERQSINIHVDTLYSGTGCTQRSRSYDHSVAMIQSTNMNVSSA